MTLTRLIAREIVHRKLNFGLSLVAVVVAVAACGGALAMLSAHDRQTEIILERNRAAIEKQNKQLEDEMRIITKKMGFNVEIRPKGQDSGNLFGETYMAEFMPEAYVTKLSESPIVTVRHLLPIIEQRVKWEERDGRTVFVVGVRGEVPLAHRDPKKPIMHAVPPGKIVLGNEIASTEALKVGDTLTLLGERFEVAKIHGPRGTKDDITVFINLATAQALFDREGQINAIMALECKCAWADLAKVRAEIAKFLPDTKVTEKGTVALARAEARNAATAAATAALKQEAAGRAELRDRRQTLAMILVPLVILVAGLWVALLSWLNVRQRRDEIGIWRAVGMRSRQILMLFLGKAVVLGLLGAAIGFTLGHILVTMAGTYSESDAAIAAAAQPLFNWTAAGLSLVLAPLLAVLASWLPAFAAAQQDPAAILARD